MTHDVYGAPDWLSRQAGSESSAGHKQQTALLLLVSRLSHQPSEVFYFINCAVTTSLCCNTSGTRSNMRLWCPVLLCLTAALSTAFVISPPHMWTKLILTHHWPKTFCSMEHCHANISFWTLHGLWPDKGIDCNSSWHFNSSQIEDLLPDMKKSWPDLLKPFSTEFWKYEWHKHGTCAAKADSLNSQHKYFGKALELYHKLDLDSILKKFDIIPSENYYKLSQIEGVIENFYNVKPKIQCAHPTKNDDFQTLGQIEICFDTDFTLVDCERHTMETISREDWDNTIAVDRVSGFSVCDHDMPVYYPPALP